MNSTRMDTPTASPLSPGNAAQAGESLVRVEGLSKTFDLSASWLSRLLSGRQASLLRAVDGVSFTIPRGATLALVGESGCGKSTLARLLVGLHQPTSGQVLFDGTDVHQSIRNDANGALARQLRQRVQMIFQDPYASLDPRWTVGEIVAEPLLEHGLASPGPELEERVGALLQSVGLSGSDRTRFPHQFSGGQRQRISIARALATEPDFLVCDEPTSALDVSVQAQVLNLMRELQRERGLTYLFISHNLAVVRYVSDSVGVMYLGRLVEWAPKARLFANPKHPYTRMLLDAIPKLRDTGRARTPVQGEVPDPLDPPTGCAFHPRCPLANERCRRERPILIGDETGVNAGRVACHAVEEGRVSA